MEQRTHNKLGKWKKHIVFLKKYCNSHVHYSQGHSERNHSPQMCLWFILQELISTSQIFLLPVNTKENGKPATDRKITAVHGCRTCHCLSNLQAPHSRTNECLCLSPGFLSADNKHTKGTSTNACLPFNLEPVVCPVCRTALSHEMLVNCTEGLMPNSHLVKVVHSYCKLF